MLPIDFPLDAIKKRLDAEKNLSKNLEDKDQIEREFFKKKEQVKSSGHHNTFRLVLSREISILYIFIQSMKSPSQRSLTRSPDRTDSSQVNRPTLTSDIPPYINIYH